MHTSADAPASVTAVVRQRRARWLAAAVLVAVSALLIVRVADGALLREGLAELAGNPRLIAALLGAYAAAFLLRALAWRALLGPVGRGAGPGPGMGPLVAILHAALFANHALPVKAGEALRPALAARAGVPIADATVSTVVARLLDVAALLAIAAALLPLTTAAGEGPLVLAVPALLVAPSPGRCSGSARRPSAGRASRCWTACGCVCARRCGRYRLARCSGRSCSRCRAGCSSLSWSTARRRRWASSSR